MNSKFLIGTYTKRYSKGIYELTIDENGLGDLRKVFKLNNPTYLDMHENLLISSHGADGIGGVVLFNYKDETLYPLDKSDKFTCSPCHVSIYKQFALSSNYHDGIFILYKITPDNYLKEVNRITLKESNLHFSSVYKDHLYLVDAKNATIYIYDFSTLTLLGKIELELFSKPRHIAFKNNLGYIITEGTNQIIIFSTDDFNILAQYEPLDLHSTDLEGSAILIKDDLLYSAERKTNTISVFKILETGELQHLQNFNHETINAPRDFTISKDNRLICLNSLKDSISIFTIDSLGLIKDFQSEIFVPEPICVKEL
ncbi:beta-propeller fold lactonase family protein [uncultured Clostridium sp.]|uniref:lactonase family protein n=1 Tax=uncultured Clostridium sp. TaxID=59620 RepID=UPI00262464DE|nr:beta-propeller fold lactonase family protein [uncultured Clostridium sp.]